MLKKILMEIGAGCTSICELSGKLGIDKQALLGQLQTLIQQGYLAVQEKHRCETCSRGCQGCGMAGSPNTGVTLLITDKGRKLLEKN